MHTTEQFRDVSNTVLDNIIVQQEIWMDNNPDSPRWFEWRTERNRAVAEWHRRRSVARNRKDDRSGY